MGRAACTEPQCLYKGDLYLYLHPEINAIFKVLLGRTAQKEGAWSPEKCRRVFKKKKIILFFSLHTNMSRCICTEREAPDYGEVYSSLQDGWFSVSNFYLVTFLAP